MHVANQLVFPFISYSCFISNTTTFFAAFLGPILLMLFFNTILFVAVVVVLLKHIYKRSTDKRHSTIKLMANIATIGVLFGLTWIFGAFTILKADEAFQIVFTGGGGGGGGWRGGGGVAMYMIIETANIWKHLSTRSVPRFYKQPLSTRAY